MFTFEILEAVEVGMTAQSEASWLSVAEAPYNMRRPVQLPEYRKPQSHPEYCTVREAQELLGVSGPKMWRMVRDGELTAYQDTRDKRRKLVRRADVDALMQIRPLDNRRKPTPADIGETP